MNVMIEVDDVIAALRARIETLEDSVRRASATLETRIETLERRLSFYSGKSTALESRPAMGPAQEQEAGERAGLKWALGMVNDIDQAAEALVDLKWAELTWALDIIADIVNRAHPVGDQ